MSLIRNAALRLLTVLMLFGCVPFVSAQSIRLTGLVPGPNSKACTSPDFVRIYGTSACVVVASNQKVTWEPEDRLLVVQCYQNGRLLREFGKQSGVASNAISFAECAANLEGETEVKLWQPGASLPSTAAPLKMVLEQTVCPAARLTLDIRSPLRYDAPVRWTPESCLLTVQGYEGGQLTGQALRVLSGAVTVGQLSRETGVPIEIKIWLQNAPQSADSRFYDVNDCSNPRLTTPMLVTPETQVTWIPTSCRATVQAYQHDRLIRESSTLSGVLRLKELVDDTGRTELKLWPTGSAQPSDGRFVVAIPEADAFLRRFEDNFDVDWGWSNPPFDEIVNPNCFATGISRVSRHNGASPVGQVLEISANDKETTSCNHVIVGNRLTDAGQNGRIVMGASVFIPLNGGMPQVSFEASLQNTKPRADGITSTWIGGLQNISDPLADDEHRDGWGIWTSPSSGQKPRWVVVARQRLPRDRWIRVELEVDFTSNEYIRFSINGAGINRKIDLRGRYIVPESRGFEPGLVLTLENENLATPAAPRVTRSVLEYDDVQLSRPLRVASAADPNSTTLASQSIFTISGDRLATETAAIPDQSEPPLELSHVRVMVKDSSGSELPASILAVSPERITGIMPLSSALGPATVTVSNSEESLGSASANIERVAPALFSADGSGHGIAAGAAVRCGANGCQVQPASDCSPAGCRARPIDIADDASVFLSVVGTGFRGRTDISSVHATLGVVAIPVRYAGPIYSYPGMDELDIGPLPTDLSGQGIVELVLTVEGRPANVLQLNIK